MRPNNYRVDRTARLGPTGAEARYLSIIKDSGDKIEPILSVALALPDGAAVDVYVDGRRCEGRKVNIVFQGLNETEIAKRLLKFLSEWKNA